MKGLVVLAQTASVEYPIREICLEHNWYPSDLVVVIGDYEGVRFDGSVWSPVGFPLLPGSSYSRTMRSSAMVSTEVSCLELRLFDFDFRAFPGKEPFCTYPITSKTESSTSSSYISSSSPLCILACARDSRVTISSTRPGPRLMRSLLCAFWILSAFAAPCVIKYPCTSCTVPMRTILSRLAMLVPARIITVTFSQPSLPTSSSSRYLMVSGAKRVSWCKFVTTHPRQVTLEKSISTCPRWACRGSTNLATTRCPFTFCRNASTPCTGFSTLDTALAHACCCNTSSGQSSTCCSSTSAVVECRVWK
mmetsp:Transcript_34481/g.71168  ORF Transcript_34481/g.71168 Transcript_34481/m.71168 type:complete len:306 (-) Transcript_34481:221-1138(-)